MKKTNTHIWLVFNFNLKRMESKDQTRYSVQRFLCIRMFLDNKL